MKKFLSIILIGGLLACMDGILVEVIKENPYGKENPKRLLVKIIGVKKTATPWETSLNFDSDCQCLSLESVKTMLLKEHSKSIHHIKQ